MPSYIDGCSPCFLSAYMSVSTPLVPKPIRRNALLARVRHGHTPLQPEPPKLPPYGQCGNSPRVQPCMWRGFPALMVAYMDKSADNKGNQQEPRDANNRPLQ